MAGPSLSRTGAPNADEDLIQAAALLVRINVMQRHGTLLLSITRFAAPCPEGYERSITSA